MNLRDWLAERQKSAETLARLRPDDRSGWLEDADYFRRAGEAVAELERRKRSTVPRDLTSAELADCCGGCRTNSAIETWMRRAVTKFCEVNGIRTAGVPAVGANTFSHHTPMVGKDEQ